MVGAYLYLFSRVGFNPRIFVDFIPFSFKYYRIFFTVVSQEEIFMEWTIKSQYSSGTARGAIEYR